MLKRQGLKTKTKSTWDVACIYKRYQHKTTAISQISIILFLFCNKGELV